MKKASLSSRDSLVGVLTGIYQEIRDLELEHNFLGGEGDFRPRIEYFHDAVRAYSAGMTPETAHSRLSVEHLAYDLSALRYIEAYPFSPLLHPPKLSPHQKVAVPKKQEQHSARSQELKKRLSHLYMHYAVLFAALFKQTADDDYETRVQTLDEEVTQLSQLEHALEALAEGKGDIRQVEAALKQLNHQELKDLLASVLQQRGSQREKAIRQALRATKDRSQAVDREIAGIGSAHFTYATSQLAVYENAKGVVKSLADKGLNLAGRFVEEAAARTTHDLGRGR